MKNFVSRPLNGSVREAKVWEENSLGIIGLHELDWKINNYIEGEIIVQHIPLLLDMRG